MQDRMQAREHIIKAKNQKLQRRGDFTVDDFVPQKWDAGSLSEDKGVDVLLRERSMAATQEKVFTPTHTHPHSLSVSLLLSCFI